MVRFSYRRIGCMFRMAMRRALRAATVGSVDLASPMPSQPLPLPTTNMTEALRTLPRRVWLATERWTMRFACRPRISATLRPVRRLRSWYTPVSSRPLSSGSMAFLYRPATPGTLLGKPCASDVSVVRLLSVMADRSRMYCSTSASVGPDVSSGSLAACLLTSASR
ncbi:hypothetical protein VTG60DRAFT_4770 [Thermothelomyces hinnuleus]